MHCERVKAQDAVRAHEIICSSNNENVSFEWIENRLGDTFWGIFADQVLIGIVGGTLESGVIHHGTLSTLLKIDLLTIDPEHRRQGVARALLTSYINHIVQMHGIHFILLDTPPELSALFITCGFQVTRSTVKGTLECEFDCIRARQLEIVHVDAFAKRAFEGNPAAVVLLSTEQYHSPQADAWMQRVAMEQNLSDTAFVAPALGASANEFDLRWFTPQCEVALCGHATLATAFTIYQMGLCDKKHPVQFHSKSGLLSARYVHLNNTNDGAIQLSFPIAVRESHSEDWYHSTTQRLAVALGIHLADIVAADHYGANYICHLTHSAYESIQPDFTRLMDLPCLAVVVTCQAPTDVEYDFFSRFFAPKLGVNEDPVTGSAHCALVPYWHEYLPTHPLEFRARQTSTRGGDLVVRLDKDRVSITGSAVFTLRGRLAGSIV